MIVHFILPGETLESVSEDIKLENPQYLKDYHNKLCAKEDYIHEDLIPRKKLLIPDAIKIIEFNEKNDAPCKSPAQNPQIIFNPETLNKKYTVDIIETKEKDDGITRNSLFFEVHLKWIRKEEENHVFHFFKNEISGSNDCKMTDLATECIRSLKEFVIRTDSRGAIVSISLQKEIIDGFQNIKERLIDLFPDQYARIYIDEFEYAVLNDKVFNKRMKEDTFIKTYFAPVRNDFRNGKSYFKQLIYDDIFLDIEQKVRNNSSQEFDFLQIGRMEENAVKYKGEYSLHPENGIIKKAEIYYSVSRFGAKHFTHIIIDEMF
ncbi:hypothetical protein ACM39_03300 [Chryseobacterium sp. FH2]|uniref:hypothetical protein n=1 Tax=Chryseobacterium sp. FH2 TaxID=1674291 RepID=UPI00065AEE38|nr:hypothetical protein [Chryseobacterium sp. FH2]KMQ69151.1 hypothetical protein ACM39_03300 [Chryseobacterium sp. FH2]